MLSSVPKATSLIELMILGSLASCHSHARNWHPALEDDSVASPREVRRKPRPAAASSLGVERPRVKSECPSSGPPSHVVPELEVARIPCVPAAIQRLAW